MLTTARKLLMRPTGALLLLALAALLWGVMLIGQTSPAHRHLEAGIEYARQRRSDEAEREWRETTRLAPDDPRAWNYLAELYTDTRDWPDALECLHHLEGRKPEIPHLSARLAQCSLLNGQEQAAYRYAQASLQKEPDDPATILLFCGLLTKTHENQRRLDLLRYLSGLQPDSLPTQLLLAATLTDKRQFDEAGPLVARILQRDPGNLEACSLQGMILLNTDPSPEGSKRAEGDFLRAVTAPRFAAFAHFHLGKIYKRRGEPGRAIPHLEAAAQALPTRREIWYELADAYAQAGRSQDAGRARRHSEALTTQKSAGGE